MTLRSNKTVAILRQGGHKVVAASPKGGVNTVTGQGLKDAKADAQVVIDLSNAPSRGARRCWNASRPRAATFSRQMPRRAFSTMSRYHGRDQPHT
jgi:hypothetical protein